MSEKPTAVETATAPAPPMLSPERLAFSPQETARLLGIGRNTAYDAIQRGEIPSVRIGNRIVVPRDALVEMLNAGQGAAKD